MLYKCYIELHDELNEKNFSYDQIIEYIPVSVAIKRCNVGNHTNVCGSRPIQLTNISSRIIPS